MERPAKVKNQTTENVLIYSSDKHFRDVLNPVLKTHKLLFAAEDKVAFKSNLQKNEIGIVILQTKTLDELQDLLALRDFFQKDAQVILNIDSVDLADYQLIQNQHFIYRSYTSVKAESLPAVLTDAKKAYLDRKDKKNLLIKYHQKNKKWKELTNKLHLLDHEKRIFIQKSKQQEQSKKLDEKRTRQFIANLSYVSSVDDYIKALQRELKRFVDVLSLSMLVEHNIYGHVVYTVQRNQFLSKPLSQAFGLKNLSEEQGRKYLADILDRPILQTETKVLAFKGTRKGYIIFEFEKDPGDAFKEFWNETQQALAMILDRLLLRLEIENIRQIWERTFESLSAPLVILDREGLIVKMNTAFLKIQNFELMKFLVKSHKSNSDKDRLEWKTSQQDYELFGYPVVLSGTNVSASLYYFHDRRQIHESYSKMVQTEKMAAVGLLAGNIAHELNNPLSGLKSISELLLQEAGFTSYHQDIREIYDGVNRCLKTIKNLQIFSMGDNDTKTVFEAEDLIHKTLPLLKSALRTFSLHLELNTNKKITGNFHLLQQVIFNLLHNAIQSLQEQGKIEISINEIDNMIAIAIADNGRGIPAELMPQLFEPFFTTKEVGHGTGLGLHISKRIVEAHGGYIEVRSNSASGSCFTVVLPIAGSSDENTDH